jgi:hypothetical protein
MKPGNKTKERRFLRPLPDRREQGSLESVLPWILTFAAIALFLLAAVARAEDPRTLTAQCVLDVERSETGAFADIVAVE